MSTHDSSVIDSQPNQLIMSNYPQNADAQDSTNSTQDIVHIDAEFSKLVLSVQYYLQGQEALENCKDFCLYLCVDKGSRESLFNDIEKQKVEKCKSFKELFSILCNHWGWDEYGILKHLTEICGSQDAQEEIEKYELKMAGLKLIFTQNRSDLPSGYENFVVIINKSFKKFTVEQYKSTKKFIFDNLNVYQYVSCPPFVHVLHGSVNLHWHIKCEAISCMIEAALKRKEVFIKKSYVFMQIGNTVIFDKNQVCYTHVLDD